MSIKIPCASNPLLDELDAEKLALAALLVGVSAGGMGAITAQAGAMKAKLDAMIPSVPEVPNFKNELNGLKGKKGVALAVAVAAIQSKWGDALPDVDIAGLAGSIAGGGGIADLAGAAGLPTDAAGLASAAGLGGGAALAVGAAVALAGGADVTDLASAAGLPTDAAGLAGAAGFDFCKDVPNIDATSIVNGKISGVKDKGAAITTAVAIPEKVKNLVPTVVSNETLPSSGTSAMPRKEIFSKFTEFKDNTLKPIEDAQKKDKIEAAKSASKMRKSPEIKSAFNKASAESLDITTFFNSGNATASDKKAIEKYFVEQNKASKANAVAKKFSKINTLSTKLDFNPDDLSSGDNGKVEWKEYVVKGGKLVTVKQKSESEVQGYIQGFASNKSVIAELNKYKGAIV